MNSPIERQLAHPHLLRRILLHLDDKTLLVLLAVNREFFVQASRILYRHLYLLDGLYHLQLLRHTTSPTRRTVQACIRHLRLLGETHPYEGPVPEFHPEEGEVLPHLETLWVEHAGPEGWPNDDEPLHIPLHNLYRSVRPRTLFVNNLVRLSSPPTTQTALPAYLAESVVNIVLMVRHLRYFSGPPELCESLVQHSRADRHLIVIFTDLDELKDSPSDNIRLYLRILKDLVLLCTDTDYQLIFAATAWALAESQEEIEPGRWEVEKELKREARKKLLLAGNSREEVAERLGRVRCVEVAELEKEAWAGAFEGDSCKDWFSG